MQHLRGLHVLILGLGDSGLAMARWCARWGAVVQVADTRDEPPHRATLQQQCPEVALLAGPFDAALVQGTPVRAVFKSPGLSPQQVAPVMDAARAAGLWVGTELALFAAALRELAEAETEAETEAEAVDEAVDALPATDGPEITEAEEVTEAAEAAEAATEATVEEGDPDQPPALPLAPPPAPRPGYHPAVLAITGTNGKTTVTSLTGHLVRWAGKSVAVAGNIGPTLLDTLADALDRDALPEVWVLELSSFQLDLPCGFAPTAATVLNLTQDHLDWHGSLEAYAQAKARIFGPQTLMLLNREDPHVMGMLPAPLRMRGKPPQERVHLTFGTDMPRRPGDFGLEEVNGMVWLVRAHEADETRKRRRDVDEELHIQRLMPADALRIRGRHNAANALAALALAQAAGCALGPILFALREYRGEPHRVEPIGWVHEVEFFDDSKGTNVGATVAALRGLGAERRLVVILGGEGKGQDFSPLAEPVARFARAVVLIGRDAPLIRAALQDSGVPLEDASSMEDAVQRAQARAHAGDAVLMSPACASFDMFDNYGHRARVFIEAVRALALQAGHELEAGL